MQDEVLRGRRAFGELFRRGQRLQSVSLRCVFRSVEAAPPRVAVAFVVPGNVAHAVQRNRLRRLMREAFRTERSVLVEASGRAGRGLAVVFLFHGRPGMPVARVSFGAVREEVAALCRAVAAKV